ncbi:MAG: DUF58 domain-containing protein [Phycisphaerae bacterium]|nr:DUF58 domain-containing protein [Phycisphaerae bacterium]
MIPAELLRKIRRIEIRTSRIVSEALGGQFRSAFKGRGMEFEEVRPYQIGDDVRAIDWNVSARVGDPHIKLFREERELTVLLVVDVSGSLDFGTQRQLKRELVAEVAATLAFSAIRSNDKAGLLCFSDQIERSVPARKGQRHVLRIIREVLSLSPESRGTDVGGALDEIQRVQRRRAVVFVISDFLGGPISAWETSMRLASRRHDVIPIVIDDPRERELPKVGFVELRDLESGRTAVVDTLSAKVRQRYAESALRRIVARNQAFRRMRLEPIELVTGHDIAEPLHRYFRHREIRRGSGRTT